jgi:hypothetical protein
MTQQKGPAANGAPQQHTTNRADTANHSGTGQPVASREVDWFMVATFVGTQLDRFDYLLPLPGTPRWCALSDHDPVKYAACLYVAQVWAFDAACRQEAHIQASHAISAAADWRNIGRRQADHAVFYREKPWLKRKVD